MLVSEDAWGGDFDWRTYQITDATGIIHMNKVQPPASNGGVQLVNPASTLCLDVAGGTTENGTPARLWECNGGPAQDWVLNENGALRVYGNYDKCLDMGAGGAGAALQIWDCNGTAAQQWDWHVDGSISAGEYCIDGTESMASGDAALQLQQCNGGSAQQWTGLAVQAGTPEIAGTPTVGEILTATPGVWLPGDLQLSYQWLRDGVAVAGATQSNYALRAEDAGASVAVQVTAQVPVGEPVSNVSAALPVGAAATEVTPLPLPTRLAGGDRYASNYQLLSQTMQAGKPLFVVTGQDFPDALSLGPAVSLLGGSLMFSEKSELPAQALQLLRERKPSSVYVVGSTTSLSENVVAQLQSATGLAPVRVAGKDRYETAEKIFTRFFADRQFSQVFVVTGQDYPDALSASAAAGGRHAPVLLVNGDDPEAKLPANVLALLPSTGVTQAVIVGGPEAVPDAVAAALQGDGYAVTRLTGTDRYAINLAVNEYVATQVGDVALTGLSVANGSDFLGALSGSVLAGSETKRLVLTNGTCLSQPVVSEWLRGAGSRVGEVTLIGGLNRVSAEVERYTACS